MFWFLTDSWETWVKDIEFILKKNKDQEKQKKVPDLSMVTLKKDLLNLIFSAKNI